MKTEHCSLDFNQMRALFKKALTTNPMEYYIHTRCLPYFHLAGVTKSGTTDLYDKLIKPSRYSGTLNERTNVL